MSSQNSLVLKLKKLIQMSEPLKFDLHLLNKYIQTRNVCNIIVNEKKDEQVMDLNF